MQASESSAPLVFRPSATDVGRRLDAYLAGQIGGWSRSRLQRLIKGEDILVNDLPSKASYKVRDLDVIDVDLTETPPTRFEPENNIPLQSRHNRSVVLPRLVSFPRPSCPCLQPTVYSVLLIGF